MVGRVQLAILRKAAVDGLQESLGWGLGLLADRRRRKARPVPVTISAFTSGCLLRLRHAVDNLPAELDGQHIALVRVVEGNQCDIVADFKED